MTVALEAFTATASKRKAAWYLGISIAILVLVPISASIQPENSRILIAAAVLWPLFGLAALGWIRLLAEGGAMIRINSDGVWARSWPRPVPWTAVERVSIFNTRGVSSLSLHLSDIGAFPWECGAGRLGRASRKLGLGDLLLQVAGSDRSVRDTAGAIGHFAPANVVRDFADLLPDGPVQLH